MAAHRALRRCVALTAAFGYVLEGESAAAISCVLVATVLIAHGAVQGDFASAWPVGLGFFASLSKLDVAATQTAFGELRVPIMMVGAGLALLVGIVAERGRTLATTRSR